MGASVALRGADPAAIGVRPPHAPVAAPEWRPAARVLAPIAFTLADVAAIGTAAALTYALRTAIWGPFPFHLSFWTAAAIWLVFRVFARLMPPYAMAPASELRRSTMTTLGAALTHAALLTAADQHTAWRYFGLLAWLLAIPLSWFTRAGVRILLIRRRLYGFPVVVIGTGIKACRAIREMRAARDVGFVPVAAYGEDPEKWGTEIEGVPVLGPVSAADAGPLGTQDAMIALSRSEANGAELLAITRSLAPRFPRLQVLSDLNGTANLWVFPRAVGAYLALETRHARFTPTSRAIKRAFDLLIGIPVFLLALPLMLVAAALVKVISPAGPAFFSQEREGRDGKTIRIWKIRSMVPDAAAKLEAYLASDAAARAEFARTLKLRRDPRVLPYIGGFIRRASIDELPQLWSVIVGDLSLVGPRVMMLADVGQMAPEARETRREVPPGLTGLWQVNFRNNSDLHVRGVADAYYVHNWSVWLDLWILLRTVRVVFFGSGAY